MLVVNTCGKRVRERLIDETEVCVAAIAVPAGERRRNAEVPRRGDRIGSCRRCRQARPRRPVTDGKPGCFVAEGIDNADNLVARGDVDVSVASPPRRGADRYGRRRSS